jgi:hypothetical protein
LRTLGESPGATTTRNRISDIIFEARYEVPLDMGRTRMECSGSDSDRLAASAILLRQEPDEEDDEEDDDEDEEEGGDEDEDDPDDGYSE